MSLLGTGGGPTVSISVTGGPPPPKLDYAGHVLGELSALILAGGAAGFLFGLLQSSHRVSSALYGLVIAGASALFGGLLGLLFGIPRALATGGGPTGTSTGGYAANTNLEQVSDWLTKLLLGAGLTQLGRLPGALHDLGQFLAPGFGGTGATVFSVALVIYSSLAGFFLAYLAARLRLGGALRQADLAAAVTGGISDLPPSSPGPTSLEVAGDAKPTRAKKKAALNLAEQMQAVEMQTTAATFSVDAYRRVAQELVATGAFDQALKILALAATQHPGDPSLPLYTGVIYGMHLSDYDTAEKYYLQALAVQPNYALAYYDLACNAVRRNDTAEALTRLKRAFKLDPQLREGAAKDKLWDEAGLRSDPRFAKVLAPPAAEAGSAKKAGSPKKVAATTSKGATTT